MRLFSFFVLLPALGCNNFTSVDEACHDKLGGEKHMAHDSAAEAVKRLNCYRRLAQVGRMGIDKLVQEVTEDHVNYMSLLDSFDSYVPGQETSENDGYTGANLNARLEGISYVGDIQQYMRWELTPIHWHFNGADNIDYLFPDPWARQIYLQPILIGGALDESLSAADIELYGGETWASYLTILYRFPSGHAPVVYPRDGQIDVDPSYCDDILGGALVEYGDVGYPITITMDADNIVLVDHSLQGPDGEVDTVVHLPGDVSWGSTLRGTVAITPLEPLQASAEYSFSANVKYDGYEREIESTYTTAAQNLRPTTFCGAQGTNPTARTRRLWSRHTRVQ